MKNKNLALLLLIVGGVLVYLVISNTPKEAKEYKPGPLKEYEYKWIEKQVEL